MSLLVRQIERVGLEGAALARTFQVRPWPRYVWDLCRSFSPETLAFRPQVGTNQLGAFAPECHKERAPQVGRGALPTRTECGIGACARQ